MLVDEDGNIRFASYNPNKGNPVSVIHQIPKNSDLLGWVESWQECQRNPTLKWCGSENQRVIDVQKSLKEGKIVLYE